MLDFSGYTLPNDIKLLLTEYIEQGKCPNNFIYNVLCNSLSGAVAELEGVSPDILIELVYFVSARLPGNSHGNPGKVIRYMNQHQEKLSYKNNLRPVA